MKGTGLMVLSLLVSGCEGNVYEPAWDGVGTAVQAIYGGEVADDARFGAVVGLAIRASGEVYGYCSGVFIERDVVLTAAHCLRGTEEFPFEEMYARGDIVVVGGRNMASEERRIFELEHYWVHEGYEEGSGHHDIGWVRVSGGLETASPLEILTDRGVLPGLVGTTEPLTFVGYGVDENGLDSVRQYVTGPLNAYCPASQRTCRHANRLGETVELTGGMMMHDLEKGGACHGDSGGPVLTEVNGALRVCGVISRGDDDCEVYALSTSVVDHQTWLEETLRGGGSDGCSAYRVSGQRKGERSCAPWWAILWIFAAWIYRRGMRHEEQAYMSEKDPNKPQIIAHTVYNAARGARSGR